MRRFGALTIAAVLTHMGVMEAQPEAPALADLLRGAGVYAERVERECATLVGEERYVQRVRRVPFSLRLGVSRTIVSDVFFMWVSEETLAVALRSVRAVDDMLVADSARRLEALLAGAAADPAEKERLLRDETARFNVGSVIRNFSDPTLVVQFLHPRLQPRFSFRVTGQEEVAGVPTLEGRP